MPASQATTDPAVTSLDQSEESAMTRLYRAAIGPINNDYYLPLFTRFEAADRAGPTWNWAASLYTLNWMVFRRLWATALGYVGVWVVALLLLLGVGRLLFSVSDAVETSLLIMLVAASFVLPGLYGNALLHAESRKKMNHALVASANMQEACAMLTRQAGSRQRFVWQMVMNVVWVAGAVAVYLAVPSTSALPVRVPPPAPLPIVMTPVSAPVSLPAPVASAPLSLPIVEPNLPESSPLPQASAPERMASAPLLAESIALPVAKSVVPKPHLSPAKPGRHFYINVGLFALPMNAHDARRKLLGAGLTAYTQDLETAHGKRTRLRVGPFDTRREAEAAAEKIHGLKLDALVFQAPS